MTFVSLDFPQAAANLLLPAFNFYATPTREAEAICRDLLVVAANAVLDTGLYLRSSTASALPPGIVFVPPALSQNQWSRIAKGVIAAKPGHVGVASPDPSNLLHALEQALGYLVQYGRLVRVAVPAIPAPEAPTPAFPSNSGPAYVSLQGVLSERLYDTVKSASAEMSQAFVFGSVPVEALHRTLTPVFEATINTILQTGIYRWVAHPDARPAPDPSKVRIRMVPALEPKQWERLAEGAARLVSQSLTATSDSDLIRALQIAMAVFLDEGFLASVKAEPKEETPGPKPYGWDCGGALVKSALAVQAFDKVGVSCVPLWDQAPQPLSPAMLSSLDKSAKAARDLAVALFELAQSRGE